VIVDQKLTITKFYSEIYFFTELVKGFEEKCNLKFSIINTCNDCEDPNKI